MEEELKGLIERIILRVNINLREQSFDVGPYIRDLVPPEKFLKFYAFYGLTPHHPLFFRFHNASLAGSYFLGKCVVKHSVVYKSDIRGDELKSRGDVFPYQGLSIPLHDDEIILVKDSFLMKTLVHNHSHDPENPEELLIQNTVSCHYANIHGSTVEGCFMGPFATLDLTTGHDSVIGAFSYIQAGEVAHLKLLPGTIWIRRNDDFNFLYRFDPEVVPRYVDFKGGDAAPTGILPEFINRREKDFEKVYGVTYLESAFEVPPGAALDRYAVVKSKTRLSENVLVAQRAYIENSFLGKGANAQENCYIIHSRLEGFNVTAHGGKIIHARLGEKGFVGFNSFLNGKADCPIEAGEECIFMPHTLIDPTEPVTIPPRRLVWGYITRQKDLETHSLDFEAFSSITRGLILGRMIFEGDGRAFIEGFRRRIDHILHANGAYFDGVRNRGHAQRNKSISFNTIQPYFEGDLAGLYPTIEITP